MLNRAKTYFGGYRVFFNAEFKLLRSCKPTEVEKRDKTRQ